jgi:hypothetical protein
MPRLTIELVPSSCWFSNVRSQVTAAVWDKLRKQVYKIAHRRCEICSGRGRQHPVECHEVWLFNDTLYTQTLVRLQALCPKCHQVKHIGLASVQDKFYEARAHLMNVNQWTQPSDADLYIEACFEKWAQRSNHSWTLNIDYLKQFGVDVNALCTERLSQVTDLEIQREITSPLNILAAETFDPFDHIINNERVS